MTAAVERQQQAREAIRAEFHRLRHDKQLPATFSFLCALQTCSKRSQQLIPVSDHTSEACNAGIHWVDTATRPPVRLAAEAHGVPNSPAEREELLAVAQAELLSLRKRACADALWVAEARTIVTSIECKVQRELDCQVDAAVAECCDRNATLATLMRELKDARVDMVRREATMVTNLMNARGRVAVLEALVKATHAGIEQSDALPIGKPVRK